MWYICHHLFVEPRVERRVPCAWAFMCLSHPHGSNFPQQLHKPECATVSSVQMTKSGLIRVPYHDDELSGNCALNNITSVDFPSRLKVLHTPPQEKPPLTQRAKAILFGKPDTACCKKVVAHNSFLWMLERICEWHNVANVLHRAHNMAKCKMSIFSGKFARFWPNFAPSIEIYLSKLRYEYCEKNHVLTTFSVPPTTSRDLFSGSQGLVGVGTWCVAGQSCGRHC